MHLAQRFPRSLTCLVALPALTFALSGTARADHVPLLGSSGPVIVRAPRSVASLEGLIVSVAPDSVPCSQLVTFEDVEGGGAPGSSYDGLLGSGDMLFGERFVNQALGLSGDFDAVSGNPGYPLLPQPGLSEQNLDVFVYNTNVLTGLGHLGFPDIDAIGEGSIAMYLPEPQASVSFQLVGGNGGSATLSFYRWDGSLIDVVVVSGLAEFRFGFATADASNSISGILIQNTDPSGIGVDDICHSGGVVSAREVSWGQLKMLYR